MQDEMVENAKIDAGSIAFDCQQRFYAAAPGNGRERFLERRRCVPDDFDIDQERMIAQRAFQHFATVVNFSLYK
jgi:hypothetical protein